MNHIPFARQVILSLGFAAITSSGAHAALSLVNGDFQNSAGLTSLGGGWYKGVPVGWTGRDVNYSMYAGSGNFVANIEAISNTSGSFQPLYQDVGILDEESTISITFTVLQPWNANAARVGAAIWVNGTTTLATQSDLGPGTYTVTANNVAAGSVIRIGFWRSRSNNSPGLDNVSLDVVPVPEPSVAMVALPALSCLLVVRRKGGKASLHA